MKKIMTILMIGYIIVLFNIDVFGFDLLFDSVGYGLIAFSFYQYNQKQGMNLQLVYPIVGAILVLINTFAISDYLSDIATLSWVITRAFHLMTLLEIFKLLHSRATAHEDRGYIDGVTNLRKGYFVAFSLSFIVNLLVVFVQVEILAVIALALVVVLIVFEVMLLFRINKFRSLEVI